MVTFDEFVRKELAALAGYARVLTGDRQAAHDVLADVLVKAQVKWKRIGVMDTPGAYVRRMITNAFLDERRRWSTRHLRSVPALPEVAGPDRTSSVDDRAELHLLLSRLPRQQRAAIVLRYYLDLADDEIGREIGCSAVAARSYISRGLTSLRINANQDSLDVRSARQPVDPIHSPTSRRRP